jgi:hypothetical protein
MFNFAMHVMWVKMTNLTLPLEFAQKEPDMDMATAQDEIITSASSASLRLLMLLIIIRR